MNTRRYLDGTYRSLAISLLGLLFSTPILFPTDAFSAQWRVLPARIFYEGDTRSSVVTVVNEGEEKINLQVQAMEWSQDADGKDVYKETNDIIFFPRILQIGKGEQRLIRAGIKMAAPAKEKTYRLFIEEIPQPRKTGGDATQLTVAVRFGVPVFVKPAKENLKGEITKAALAKGVLSANVKNVGNQHFRITEITIEGKNGKGEETFSTKLSGWYLLVDAGRVYSAAIPKEKCGDTARFSISLATDTKVTLTGNVDVDKAQCLP